MSRSTLPSVAVLRRQADGSWLLARGIWNSDLPLPMPAEADMP